MNKENIEVQTIPNWTNQKTDDPHLFRVVNRDGDWQFYYQDEIKRYLPAVNHILQLGFPKGQGLIQWLKKMDEAQAEKILTSAAERGAKVHAAIRDLISGLTISTSTPFQNDDGTSSTLANDEWDCLIAWTEWAKLFQPKVLKHETAVWNSKYLYAGTCDFIGSIELPVGAKLYIDDKLTVVKVAKRISILADWKTGGTYDDHKLQVAAYAGCLKSKPKAEFYTGIVRIGTKHNSGYEVRLWSREKTKYHFQRFLEARNQFKFITAKDWEPEIVKIPLSLKINVPLINERKTNASASKKSSPKNKGQERKPTKDETGEALRTNINPN